MVTSGVRREALRRIPDTGKEELGGTFLGLMAYLDAKARGDKSMPAKQRPTGGVVRAARWETRVIWPRLDCLKPNLQR
jgi:hypothetical protein